MKPIKKLLARLFGVLACGLNSHRYRVRCKTTDRYPGVRLGWQCERCGKWA